MAAGPANKLREHKMIYIEKHSSVLLSQLQSRLRKGTGSSVTLSSLSGTAYRSNAKNLCTSVCVLMQIISEMSVVMFVMESL